ncbi:hypothetical protein SELMODRAFT_413250 [Selaginella moellendorffii]|uniref:Uncharacterized protein n=1 Tax=Selaginella moellendorffii TaxID=88036 RepID=D8RNU4_SELML|nr:hypothetical protein SELMODRAFT_413250 [Selaginella moellendorffii]
MAELSRSGEKVSITGPGPYGVIQTFSPLDWNGEKRFLQTMYVIDDDCLEAAAKVEKWTPAAIEEAMEKGMFMDCGTANVTQDDPVDPFIIHEGVEDLLLARKRFMVGIVVSWFTRSQREDLSRNHESNFTSIPCGYVSAMLKDGHLSCKSTIVVGISPA